MLLYCPGIKLEVLMLCGHCFQVQKNLWHRPGVGAIYILSFSLRFYRMLLHWTGFPISTQIACCSSRFCGSGWGEWRSSVSLSLSLCVACAHNKECLGKLSAEIGLKEKILIIFLSNQIPLIVALKNLRLQEKTRSLIRASKSKYNGCKHTTTRTFLLFFKKTLKSLLYL